MKFGLCDTVIKQLQDVFRRYTNIENVLIFGSRSKGSYREGSDIDFAVIGKGLDCNKKSTPIGDHIDRVGKVFYEAA